MKAAILMLVAATFLMPVMAQQEAGDTTYGLFATILKPDNGDETGYFNIDYGRFLNQNSQITGSLSGPISEDFPDFSYTRVGYEYATAERVSWFGGAGVGYFNIPIGSSKDKLQVDLTLGVRLFSSRNVATEFKYRYQSSVDGFGDDGLHALLAGIKIFKAHQ